MKKLGLAAASLSLVFGCGPDVRPSEGALPQEQAPEVLSTQLPPNLSFDGEWYRWAPSKVKIQNPKVETIQGAFVEGEGCVFDALTDTTEAPPPGMVFRKQEIAFRDSPCERQYETGTIFAAESKGAQTFGPEYSTSSHSEVLVPEVQGSLPLLPSGANITVGGGGSGLPRKSQWIYAAYEDPIAKDVNGTHVYLDWTYDQSKAYVQRYLIEWNWWSGTGWQRASSSYGYTTNTGVAWARTYVTYKNPEFCRAVQGITGTTTWTYYNPTYFYGRYNGTSAYTLNRSKSGGCTIFLREVYDWGNW